MLNSLEINDKLSNIEMYLSNFEEATFTHDAQ